MISKNEKQKIIYKYITDNNLENFFVKKHHKSKYSLNEYIEAFVFFIDNNLTYSSYDSIIKKGKLKFPLRTSLHKFINTLSELEIMKKIYTSTVNTDVEKSNILLIDSTFIQNKNNSCIVDRNYYYYNKKGIKLTVIGDEKGIPIYTNIISANVNDCKIAHELIDSIPKKELTNKILIGDAGYHSKKLKKAVNKKKCKLLTPINIRNKKKQTSTLEIKKIDKKNIPRKCVNRQNNYKKIKNRGIGKKKNILYNKRIEIEHLFAKVKKNRLMFLKDRITSHIVTFLFYRFVELFS